MMNDYKLVGEAKLDYLGKKQNLLIFSNGYYFRDQYGRYVVLEETWDKQKY